MSKLPAPSFQYLNRLSTPSCYDNESCVTTETRKGGRNSSQAIVNTILEAHNTRLELSSSEGQGTSASFTLPVLAAGDQDRGRTKIQLEGLPGGEVGGRAHEPFHLLVIDDDLDTRSFMKLALEQHDLIVDSAGSAEDGLEKLKEFSADLILVDMGLPGMNGLEFCQLVKAAPETAEVPLLLFTARNEESLRLDAAAAGCEACLIKPVSIEDLLKHVHKAVKKPEPV